MLVGTLLEKMCLLLQYVFRPAAFQLNDPPLAGETILWIFNLLLILIDFGLPPQKSQCFTFDDEEREERKVGTFFAFFL